MREAFISRPHPAKNLVCSKNKKQQKASDQMNQWEETIAKAKAENAEYLCLDCNGIEDIRLLSSLSGLRELKLSGCKDIDDFSPLQYLSDLERLDLSFSSVRDIGFLFSLVNLKRLSLNFCQEIKDFSPLSSLVNLRELGLKLCINDDFRFLSNLNNLIALDLQGALLRVKDIGFLRPKKGLKKLDLGSNHHIEDVSALAFLTNLEYLDLSECARINDFSPLCHLSRLNSHQLLLPRSKKIENILPPASVVIHRDEVNRLHCDNGPAVFCKEGLSLYYWHGTAVSGEWVIGNPPSAKEALSISNMELRRSACEIIGWKNVIEELGAKVIDEDMDQEIGTLLEADITGSGRVRFLKVRCGTGREFVLPVPPHMRTAHQANAWTWGLKSSEYRPEVRT